MEALANFTLLVIDANAEGVQSWADRHGIPWSNAEMRLAVMAPDGAFVADSSERELSKDGTLDAPRLVAFLKKNAPVLPDARKLLDDALAQAKRDGKRVLVEESGAYCGWCVKLAQYLDEHRALIDKDFVWIAVDPRFSNGKEVIETLRKTSGGIPWTIILNSDGTPLISSDGPKGNIGYPSSEEGRAHWETMLRTAAQNLTDAEIKQLVNDLREPVTAK
jgi:hypothetical protein